jgi:hypothetical protein
MNIEQEIKNGINDELWKFKDKYKSEFTNLSESELIKLYVILGETFMNGVYYGCKLMNYKEVY